MAMYFKRYWDEDREDEFGNWGKSVWFFEVEKSGFISKQIEKYKNGKILKYDQQNKEDEFGMLGDQQLDVSEFLDFEISKEEFEIVWDD
ncbi:hypothetical protein [Seonamhaeicola sp. ML3]|uniref:hypothetical protein n=1 Tax=Seonamhaeicola sp. ML3 TaxID=2937786 RepID=UPI002010A93A|nr:hypothetical protein [Seonamhaeicola sp. ML3]